MKENIFQALIAAVMSVWGDTPTVVSMDGEE